MGRPVLAGHRDGLPAVFSHAGTALPAPRVASVTQPARADDGTEPVGPRPVPGGVVGIW